MGKIKQTIKKNFKALLKNKMSLIILFLGPILIILLMGFFYYNNNLYNINLGVYLPEKENPNALIFLDNLKQSKLNVIESTSKEDCENDIRNGFVHACIFLPENFDISANKSNTIKVKLDASRGDIVSITENLLINQLSSASKQIQIKYTQDLINSLSYTTNITYQNNAQLASLKETNSKLKANNNKIETAITQLKLTFTPDSLELSKLDDRITRVNNSVVDFVDKTSPLLNQSEFILANISTIINSELNTSSTKTELQELIDEVDYNLKIARIKTYSLKDTYHLSKLLEQTTELGTTLEKVKTSMDKLTTNIDLLLENNKNVSTSIDATLLKIEDNNNKILFDINNLHVKDAYAITEPSKIEVENIIPNSKVHLTSLFPSLIVSLVFIISVILSSTFVLSERKSQAHFRNFMTKNSAFNFLLADFLTLFSIVFIQIFTIVLIYYSLFLKMFNVELFYLLNALLPIIGTFVLIGMLIGYITNNESSNVIFAFFIIFVLLALSGQLLPLEILPQYIINFAIYNPLLISESIIRKLLLFNITFNSIKIELLIMGIYFFSLFILNFIFESFSKKRFLYQLYVSSDLSIKERLSKIKSKKIPKSDEKQSL